MDLTERTKHQASHQSPHPVGRKASATPARRGETATRGDPRGSDSLRSKSSSPMDGKKKDSDEEGKNTKRRHSARRAENVNTTRESEQQERETHDFRPRFGCKESLPRHTARAATTATATPPLWLVIRTSTQAQADERTSAASTSDRHEGVRSVPPHEPPRDVLRARRVRDLDIVPRPACGRFERQGEILGMNQLTITTITTFMSARGCVANRARLRKEMLLHKDPLA
ncbi:uncharacterized protein BXZ73DRAFT_77514 [Epithele typhae]|uniref:uncharacterized protein n=1 Tax=Epithele typhae TaxID=378194 RepID=UPI0020089213|nr:uncharacterized protein BXZ73DRAFT_77514 [Epithele typhae]KAH9932832.1 hypothetical protein BXZ73DRAFT_77514 [Epithele typhae]